MTQKQAAFVDAWDGNIATSAKRAGVTKSTANTWLSRNLEVIKAIKARDKECLDDLIAGSDEIRRFWTHKLRDQESPWDERNKAGENLGKCHGMFKEIREHDIGPSLADLVRDLATLPGPHG